MAGSELPDQSDRNGQFLRQRRARILEDKREDERIKGVIKKSIAGSGQCSSHVLKTFLVVITALLCTVGALLHQTNPKFLKRIWQKPIPPLQFATRYPRDVIVDRDLPRFFNQYTIATPENAHAREAMRKVIKNRNQLGRRSVRLKSSVKAWDNSHVEQLLEQYICGAEFVNAYRRATSEHGEDDLLMWCIIASRVAEGYFKESVEIIDSPVFLTRKRGIVVQREIPAGVADGYGELSTSFYLHPRSDGNTAINYVPSKLLGWLVSSENFGTEREMDTNREEDIGKLLYDLVVTQGHENDYLILKEICQEEQPRRSVAYETKQDGTKCYIVVPEKYGGNFDPTE